MIDSIAAVGAAAGWMQPLDPLEPKKHKEAHMSKMAVISGMDFVMRL